VAFRAQTSAAPLKSGTEIAKSAASNIFPRSNERGSVEV
jgi:hypothetical protein